MRRTLVAISLVVAAIIAACGDAEPSATTQLAVVTTTTTASTTTVATTTTAATATTTSVATTTNEPPPTTLATPGPDDPAAGTVRVDAAGVEQVWVPVGLFRMGTDDPSDLDPPAWARTELTSEQPGHDVQLTRGFWIDRYEVTNASFAEFVAAGGYEDSGYWSEDGLKWLGKQAVQLPASCAANSSAHPRACITWYEAEAYAAWRGGRLPTEAEWEFAARGPESQLYPWGDVWDPSLANIVDSDGAVAVGSYPGGASWVGAEDMSGNVMEWVADWWSFDYYRDEVGVDPAGPDKGIKKVEKGGWWGAIPYVGRAAYRHFEDPPSYQDHHIGVRIATDA